MRAMQIVVRVEKDNPPTLQEAINAMSKAFVEVYSSTDPSVQAAIQAWEDGKIRKIVKRARGSKWSGVLDTPGAIGSFGDAQVLVCVPTDVSEVPDKIRKLQGSETTLTSSRLEWIASGLNVVSNPNIEMSSGKLLAQVGHAIQLSYKQMSNDARALWAASDYVVNYCVAASGQWEGTYRVVIRDAGFTEIEAGSKTVMASW